jgi:hypothetical protein
MILAAFTFVHVALSLIGIVTGAIVLAGMLSRQSKDQWTSWFLWTTLATSVTGFLFPFHGFLPSHGIGILSLIALAVAIPARPASHKRRTYAISAVAALYLNVFVLIAQIFQKTPFLRELPPDQGQVAFGATQAVVLVAFIGLGIRAAARAGGASLMASPAAAIRTAGR